MERGRTWIIRRGLVLMRGRSLTRDCAASLPSLFATPRIFPGRSRTRDCREAPLRSSQPASETKACGASAICSPRGTARRVDASVSSPPPRWPKCRLPSCFARCAPSPRIALVTERIRRDDPVPGLRPQPEDALEDATQGGARAVRQDRLVGSLEVGKKADLLVVDTQRAHLVPAGRIVSAWIHNGQPSDIESVMVDGQFVMRNRKVLTMDEDSIVREADTVGKRIWKQVQAAGPVAVPRRSTRA